MWSFACRLTPVLALGFLASACVDTSIPNLNMDLGEGRTPGPYCSATEIAEFPPEELRIHLIDVGQGEAIWVQTPYYGDVSRVLESRNILIDAGPSGEGVSPSPGGDIVVNYMLSHGLPLGWELDAFVLTHAHEDHYGGTAAVLSAFEIARYVDPGFDANSFGFRQAQQSARTKVGSEGFDSPVVGEVVPRVYSQTGLFGDEVKATVLWGRSQPLSSTQGGTQVNNTSVAFALSYADKQVLLLGDIESEVEQELVVAHDAGEIDLRSSVLKVAHHGSSGSSSPEFLARVFPSISEDSWAVISSGRQSFSGSTLPTEATLARLRERLAENRVLSTENGDDLKEAGKEHDDDHIIVRISSDGIVRSCYAN